MGTPSIRDVKSKSAHLVLLLELVFVFLLCVLSFLSTLFVMDASIVGFAVHSNMTIFNPIVHGLFAPAIDTDLKIKNMTQAVTYGNGGGDQFSGASGPNGVTRNGNHTLESKVTHYLPAGTAIMAVYWTVFAFLVHLILVLALRKGVYMEESGKCTAWWISQTLICEATVFLLTWNLLFKNLSIFVYILGDIYLIYRIYSIKVISRFANDISECSTYNLFH